MPFSGLVATRQRQRDVNSSASDGSYNDAEIEIDMGQVSAMPFSGLVATRHMSFILDVDNTSSNIHSSDSDVEVELELELPVPSVTVTTSDGSDSDATVDASVHSRVLPLLPLEDGSQQGSCSCTESASDSPYGRRSGNGADSDSESHWEVFDEARENFIAAASDVGWRVPHWRFDLHARDFDSCHSLDLWPWCVGGRGSPADVSERQSGGGSGNNDNEHDREAAFEEARSHFIEAAARSGWRIPPWRFDQQAQDYDARTLWDPQLSRNPRHFVLEDA